ncbi:MAG: hypothetical protein LWY06_09665 [Firmicutes bacterium]|nr:hypothetical protein [Bacillota bacterium]
MKKIIAIVAAVFLLQFFAATGAHAVATLSGVLIKKEPGKRMIIIKLKSGTEKRITLAPGCQAYRLNEKALLTSFQLGEEIVVKICSPLNEDPLRAEILMDKFSAAQYLSFKTVTPTYDTNSKSGGFATTCGAAPNSMPANKGNYPGGSNWDTAVAMPTMSSPTGGSMTANPAPWGSPYIGPAISGGGSDASWGSPAGGTISSPAGGGPGSITTDSSTSGGVDPKAGAWVANPVKQTKSAKPVEMQGKISQINANYNAIYVTPFGKTETYTVMVRGTTRVTDFMTKQPLTFSQFQMNQVVKITGTTASEGIIDASSVMVQR